MRSPDYHIHQQQQHQEEDDEALCSGSAAHIHSRAYSLGVGSDVDTEPEVDPSPNHGLQHMWMRGLKSEQSSCLTSRANSALSLTDTEHDRKSEPDNGECNMKYKVLSLIVQKVHFALSVLQTFDDSFFLHLSSMQHVWHLGCIVYVSHPECLSPHIWSHIFQ